MLGLSPTRPALDPVPTTWVATQSQEARSEAPAQPSLRTTEDFWSDPQMREFLALMYHWYAGQSPDDPNRLAEIFAPTSLLMTPGRAGIFGLFMRRGGMIHLWPDPQGLVESPRQQRAQERHGARPLAPSQVLLRDLARARAQSPERKAQSDESPRLRRWHRPTDPSGMDPWAAHEHHIDTAVLRAKLESARTHRRLARHDDAPLEDQRAIQLSDAQRLLRSLADRAHTVVPVGVHPDLMLESNFVDWELFEPHIERVEASARAGAWNQQLRH